MTDTTLIVGVEIVGSPCEYDREYRISLDAEHTTARQGDHYDALRELSTLPANASSAGVPVHVHRLNLDDETVYAVRLQLAETRDFRLGVAETGPSRSASPTGSTVPAGGTNSPSGSESTMSANTRNS